MNFRLFITAWLAGLPGVFAVALLALPMLVAGRSLPVPLWVVQLANAAQGAVLLALAVLVGVLLAPKVKLVAPVLEAIAAAKPVAGAFRPQLVPGLVGGIVGAGLLGLFAHYSPEALTQLHAKVAMPAIVRLLYGGITEELLVRWGLMTLLVWLFWRVFQGGAGTPSRLVVLLAIGVSAIAFGLGHLPAAAALVGHLPVSLVLYIVLANAVFGVVAGWLYWRFGLEAAMVAHITVHVLFLMVSP
ncbi:CPBP family intramembrane metalloprotease [Crenobacter sp. SG2305]|uniref:CPBP family intramembrane glutamic endopeptidase n=1 Tax=Crenobacter oryzisoli TaxID=3056844 RepID=UPI0025AA5ECD|nr:CPBP family intramembrane glutamic endopeptidase [Crenobacter sp. SG2305]MDN0083691.1 CPBP family intramembrane metalloprotease [Crenobacter sp. SG2305]